MKNQHHAGKKRFLLCMLQRANPGIGECTAAPLHKNRATGAQAGEPQPGILPSTAGQLMHKIMHTDDAP
ncbi:hypothetical protein [Desulfovibrio intestinalis]|uniref:Uncharacterized protein n=1 Tax=Desulfovibrio intestinalis TaxID=58621 RepID=A0A7W8C303_9BACT|nr:hypothetical protein [Desulfovibrio intestinalis]MBB5144670.1 hypothetical protein [Desulfovibrio intestinalis]